MTTERDRERERERERMAAELRRGSISGGAGERGTVSDTDYARTEKPVGRRAGGQDTRGNEYDMRVSGRDMRVSGQNMSGSGEGMMRGGAPLRERMSGGALAGGGFPSTAAGEGGGTAVRKPRAVTEDTIRRAFEIYQEYDKGFREFVERCKQNETIYRQQFEFLRKGNARADGEGRHTDFATRSAWLLNSINNKHADCMDNMPSPQILPREESDKATAAMLQDTIPVILERNEYEETYSAAAYTKIKFGMSIQAVVWDSSKDDGIGDIDIRQVNVLNCRWDPYVEDIQDSRNFFFAELVDNDILYAQFPWCRDRLKGDATDIDEFDEKRRTDMTGSERGKSKVINWYYKRRHGSRTVLHYCKFSGDVILFASENLDQFAESGYYEHGMYPFVTDTMYPEENSAFAFGTIDTAKECQQYIDTLQGAILKNALLACKRRKLVREDGQINLDDLADYDKDIIRYKGQLGADTMVDLTPPVLPDIYVQILQSKIEELKETTHCRDFSQGSTASGVTAASAIAALQEAGSKTSRDFIKGSYRAYKKICTLVIELIRQFYDVPRAMRIITPNGTEQFVKLDNTAMRGDVLNGRKPIYDIVVTAQKSSPYSTMAQNELAKELYGAGMFNPQLADQAKLALDMMDFEGKETVLRQVAENSRLMQAVTQLREVCARLAAVVDAQNGSTVLASMQQEGLPGVQPQAAPNVESSGVRADALGGATQTKSGSMADKMKAKAMDMAAPR